MRLLVPAALSLAAFSSTPVREFQIDAGHSDVAFSIGFLGRSVRGRFDDIRGTIVYAAGNPSASAVTVVIGVKSIATGSSHRDEHLRSSDFFDVAKYPTIVFRSTSITRRRDTLFAAGALTMHGVMRTIVIPFRETSAPLEDPHGSTIVGFTGALRIARKDFGILGGSKFNDWFDDLRSATMADSVDITLDVTGWDTDVDRTRRYDGPMKRIEAEGAAPTLRRLTQMRAEHPDSLAGVQWDLGLIARGILGHGRTADALALLRFSVETWPSDPSTHVALARAFETLANIDSARVHTMKALALNPLEPRALELGRRLGMPQSAP